MSKSSTAARGVSNHDPDQSIGEIRGPVHLTRWSTRDALSLPRHGHPDVHACFVLGGTILEREANGTREMLSGTGRLSPAGDEHRLQTGSDGVDCVILHFDSNQIDQPGVTEVSERHWIDSGWGTRVAGRLRHEIEVHDDVSELSTEMLGWELVAGIKRLAANRPAGPPRWLSRVRDRIRGDLKAIPTLGELALDVGVSRAHLAKGFHHHFGVSAGEYIRLLRAHRATSMLRQTELPISSIAHSLGYSDQSHLTRQLRARLGVTPGMLRRPTGDATLVQDSLTQPA